MAVTVRRVWLLLAPLAAAFILAYFLYHTIEGDRGWVAQMKLQNQVDQAQTTLDRLHKEREALDHRVKLMRPESLDPDLLEEESRKSLNFSKPNEIIVLTPPSPPAKDQAPVR